MLNKYVISYMVYHYENITIKYLLSSQAYYLQLCNYIVYLYD